MNRKQKKNNKNNKNNNNNNNNNNNKKELRRVQDEKGNSKREVFIEFESVVKDVVRILS